MPPMRGIERCEPDLQVAMPVDPDPVRGICQACCKVRRVRLEGCDVDPSRDTSGYELPGSVKPASKRRVTPAKHRLHILAVSGERNADLNLAPKLLEHIDIATHQV